MKILALIIICTLIIQLVLAIQMVGAATVPALPASPLRTCFCEDFEAGDTVFTFENANCYWIKPTAATAALTVQSEDSNKYLQYQLSNVSDNDSVYAPYKMKESYASKNYASTKLMFSTNFRINTDTPDDAFVGLNLRRNDIDGSAKYDGIKVGISKNGLKFQSTTLGTVNIPNTSVVKGIWNKLSLVIYCNSSKYDIFLNDVYCATVNNWLDANFLGYVSEVRLDQFGTLNSIAKKFDFDNMALYDYPASAETVYTGAIPGPYTPTDNNSATEAYYNDTLPVAATVNATAPSVTIQWRKDTKSLATSYAVYRRLLGTASWGTAIATGISPALTSYTDTTVSPGTAYEYRVDMIKASGSNTNYISTGIQIPAVENKGTVILLIDNTIKDGIAPELDQCGATRKKNRETRKKNFLGGIRWDEPRWDGIGWDIAGNEKLSKTIDYDRVLKGVKRALKSPYFFIKNIIKIKFTKRCVYDKIMMVLKFHYLGNVKHHFKGWVL